MWFNVAFIVGVFVNGFYLLVTSALLELEAFRKANTMGVSIFDKQMVVWQLDSQKLQCVRAFRKVIGDVCDQVASWHCFIACACPQMS